MYRIHPVTVGGTPITGIQDVNAGHGIDIQRALSDGGIDPRFAAIVNRDPRATFNTLDLLTALGVVGMGGTIGNVVLFDKAVTATGAAEGGSLHVKYTLASCLTVLRRVTARAGGLATASYECFGYGSTAPMTVQTAQALAEDSTGSIKTYTVGPVAIGAVVLNDVTSVDLDTGVAIRRQLGETNPWPKQVAIEGKLPLITVSTSDPAAQATVVAAGSAITTVTVYLRQRAMTGTHYASGGNHISLTMTAGLVIPIGTGGGDREFTFGVLPAREAGAEADPTILVALDAALPA